MRYKKECYPSSLIMRKDMLRSCRTEKHLWQYFFPSETLQSVKWHEGMWVDIKQKRLEMCSIFGAVLLLLSCLVFGLHLHVRVNLTEVFYSPLTGKNRLFKNSLLYETLPGPFIVLYFFPKMFWHLFVLINYLFFFIFVYP